MSDTTVSSDLVLRLEAALARMEALGLIAPAAAANPDGTPSNVASGELIESAWGNAVADTIQKLLLPNQINTLADPIGKLRIVAQSITSVATNPSANAQIGFPGPFSNIPVVIVSPLNAPSYGWVFGVWGTSVNLFNVYAQRADTGAGIINATVGLNYIAIGRR